MDDDPYEDAEVMVRESNTMKHYYELLGEKKYLEETIKVRKHDLHCEFYEINKKHFRILDLLMVCVIIFNFGAVFMTNAVVARDTPDLELYEVNILQASLNDYTPHPEWKSLLTATMKQFAMWFGLIWYYMWLRRNVMSQESLTSLTIFAIAMFLILGWDFFNDLGYLFGFIL